MGMMKHGKKTKNHERKLLVNLNYIKIKTLYIEGCVGVGNTIK